MCIRDRKRFLELFSGSGHLASAFAERGVPVECWDIIHGSRYDLSRATTQYNILQAIRQKKFLMVHIGMPCSSWTRIMDINWEGKRPGCRPLRTDAQPMGIDKHANGDPLTEKERRKLADANRLLSFCLGVIKFCIKYGVMVSFENPRGSRVFLTKSFLEVADHPSVRWQTASYCQYGTPWRKNTHFVTWNCPDFALKMCKPPRGTSRSICTYTKKPHAELIGKSHTGG